MYGTRKRRVSRAISQAVHGKRGGCVRAPTGCGKSDQVGKTNRIPAAAGSLFNLKNDPGEVNDVSAKYPEKVRELTEMTNAHG